MTVFLFILFPLELLFQIFQQSCQSFEVARVGIHIEHIAIAVDEFVGREGLDLEEMLYGTLLGLRQVVVHDIVAQKVVFLDDILPCFVSASIGEIEIDEVERFQPLVLFLALRQSGLAGRTPCAPDIEKDQLAPIGLSDFAQHLLAITHIRHIFSRLQAQRLRQVFSLDVEIFLLFGM